MGSKIIILGEDVANKIAAGEVIERPASVVKELIENAIDAGSSRIDIEIENGGRSLIRVKDNGNGMNREEALLAFERHATSKIKSNDDLFSIRTLGFRGEALPSIASVSHITLITRERDSVDGTKVKTDGLTKGAVSVGTSQGTIVEVRELFFNTPARLKYLKSDTTETSHVIEAVTRQALANPAISFSLLSNGQKVLSTQGTGDLLSTIAAVLGRDTAEKMLRIDYGSGDLKITGYVSNPSLTKSTRGSQYFAVNGRPVQIRSASIALERAYDRMLAPKRHPVSVIHIQVAPRNVDVNVHPAKAEVRFESEEQIFKGILLSVKSSLGASPREFGSLSPTDSSRMDRIGREIRGKSDFGETYRSYAPSSSLGHGRVDGDYRPKEMDFQVEEPFLEPGKSCISEVNGFKDSEKIPELTPAGNTGQSALRIIGQAMNMYILAQYGFDLLIIDQHAAHEHIIYEQLAREFASNSMRSQALLFPASKELTPTETELVTGENEMLEAIGFKIDSFGLNTILIRAIPAALNQSQAEDAFDEIIALLSEGGRVSKEELVYKRILPTISCKAAIKAGKELREEEMMSLAKGIIACGEGAVCPHGRPVILILGKDRLDKEFKRR